MAKRHHNAKMHVSEGSYAGESARVRMEHHDGGMIMEDHSKIANLPQEVMIKKYAPADDYAVYGLNDTIASVDHQRKEDSKRKKKGEFPDMY